MHTAGVARDYNWTQKGFEALLYFPDSHLEVLSDGGETFHLHFGVLAVSERAN